MKLGRYKAEGAVLLLILLHASANAVWFARHTESPLGNTWGFDVRWHLANAFIFKGLLIEAYAEGGISSLLSALAEAFNVTGFGTIFPPTWPRLTYLVAVPFSWIFGDVGAGVQASSSFWLALLILFTYLLGAAIQDKLTGVIAATLVSIYPCFFGLSRGFGLDLPLAAMVAITCYCLLRSEDFSRRGWSIGCGMALGLGVLTKPQIAIFVFPVVGAMVVVRLVTHRTVELRKRTAHLCLALLLAVGLTFVYLKGSYSLILRATLWPFLHSDATSQGAEAAVPVLSGMSFYLGSAIDCITPLFFLVFLASVPFALKNKNLGFRVELLVWLLGSFMLLSLMRHQLQRFFFPAFPVIALLTAAGLATWLQATEPKKRRLGQGALGLLVLLGALQYLGVSFFSWGIDVTWGWSRVPQRFLLGDGFESGLTWAYIWSPPRAEVRRRDMKHLQTVDAVLQAIEEHGPRGGAPAKRMRLGILGPEDLRELETAFALRTNRAFSLKIFDDARGESYMVIEGLERLGQIDAFITTDPKMIDSGLLQRFRRYNRFTILITDEQIMKLEERKMRAVARTLEQGSPPREIAGGTYLKSRRRIVPLYIVFRRR